MLYTVSDLFRTYERSLRVVAGSGGLVRAVSGVGILDYELLPGLNERYRRRNFEENMVVLSTFLYAQHDPYLVTEAVKHLVNQGTSALVVKNVLHIDIPDQALRYADARDFPVFVATSADLFFDEVIYRVSRRIEDLSSADFAQREIDALLEEVSAEGIARRARRLNPSFRDAAQVLTAAFDSPLTPRDALAVEAAYRKGGWTSASSLLACHDGGLVFVETADCVDALDVSACRAPIEELVVRSGIRPRICGVGVSEPVFGLEQLADALRQARAACALARQRGEGTVRYADLGLLRAVVPFADQPPMRAFAAQVLDPLREFDAEHAAQLEATLQAYMDCGRNFDAAGERLGQHANTVRYRLDKVRAVTGLDYRVPEQAEQLSLACAIESASKFR